MLLYLQPRVVKLMLSYFACLIAYVLSCSVLSSLSHRTIGIFSGVTGKVDMLNVIEVDHEIFVETSAPFTHSSSLSLPVKPLFMKIFPCFFNSFIPLNPKSTKVNLTNLLEVTFLYNLLRHPEKMDYVYINVN